MDYVFDNNVKVRYGEGMKVTGVRHKTTIYLSDEMLAALRKLAAQNDRSLNGEMLQGLKQYIENANKRKEVQSVSTANS